MFLQFSDDSGDIQPVDLKETGEIIYDLSGTGRWKFWPKGDLESHD